MGLNPEHIYYLSSGITIPRDVPINTGFSSAHPQYSCQCTKLYVLCDKLSLFLFTFYSIFSSSSFCICFSLYVPIYVLFYIKIYPNFLFLMSQLLIKLLYATSSFICSHFLLKNVPFHFFMSLHFRSKWDWFMQLLTREMI